MLGYHLDFNQQNLLYVFFLFDPFCTQCPVQGHFYHRRPCCVIAKTINLIYTNAYLNVNRA